MKTKLRRIKIDEEVYDKLKALRRSGETFDDLVVRLAQKKQNLTQTSEKTKKEESNENQRHVWIWKT
jgi:predicted CopG family antitoxin